MNNDIACVVLNYNKYDDTIKCVNNIIEKNCSVDIVIVDNGSQNNSFEVLNDKFSSLPNTYVIKNQINSGYSAGNNYGIKFILEKNNEIKYLCVMNPDTSFDNPNIFEEMKTRLSSLEDVAVIAPVMYLRGEKTLNLTCWLLPNNIDFIKRLFIHYKSKEGNQFLRVDGNIAYTEALHGSFFMIKREVLEKMNFFDEHIFLYSEENLIGFKIKELGMKEALCLDENYLHNHPISERRLSLKEKVRSANVGSDSRLYICKTCYPKYLYPIAVVSAKLNTIIIVVRHIGGNVLKVFRKD